MPTGFLNSDGFTDPLNIEFTSLIWLFSSGFKDVVLKCQSIDGLQE